MKVARARAMAPAKQHLVPRYYVEVLAAGEDSAAALRPPASAGAPAAGRARSADEAAAEAAAAVEDDEPMLEEPQEERQMSTAKAVAAATLAEQGDYKAAVAMWSQAIDGAPADPVLYCKRGYSYMKQQKEAEAVGDFTICLDLPGCPPEQRFQALLLRGVVKQELGDLAAADADLRAAHDIATVQTDKEKAKGVRRLVVQKQVQRAQKEDARKQASKPVVHRYRTAIIEEIEPEEGSAERQEALVHARVAGWEEVALKRAAEARGVSARLAQALEAERRRVREENKARAERNAVRAARRREAAERARQACEAEQQRQQAAAEQQQQQLVWVERTRIPIELESGTGDGSGTRSSSSLSESSRSTRSRLAGYASESESESEAGGTADQPPEAGEPVAAAAAAAAGEQQPAAEQPAAAEQAVALVAAAEGQATHAAEAAAKPAEGDSPVEVAAVAAEASEAAATADEEPSLLEAAEALAAAAEAKEAAREGVEEEEEDEEEEKAEPEATAADEAAATEAAAAAVVAPEEQQGGAPSAEEQRIALLSDSELDALKDEADRLFKQGQHEAAEERYARYVRQRPTDARVWGNRAENCIKLERLEQALECCSAGLAITTPSHRLAKHKLIFRRSRAYHHMGRLQEALADMEEAEAAAEAEGEVEAKRGITKRITRLLQEMEAGGVERAPRTAAQQGLQAAAAAGFVELPAIPVVPPQPPHEVPDSLGVGVGEEQQQPAAGVAGLTQAAGAAAGAAAAEAAPAGAASGEAPHSPEEVLAALGPQLASNEEKEKGNACAKRHQWRQALRHYERAVELFPDNKEALANQAFVLLKMQRWQEAEGAAERALMLDKDYAKARYRRAHAYAGQEMWDHAVLDMEIAEGLLRAEGQAPDPSMQKSLAEWRRRQQEAGSAWGVPV